MRYIRNTLIYLLIFSFGSCAFFLPGNEAGNNNSTLLLAAFAARGGSDWVWDLPPGFPTPSVPSINPMSQAKVDLGRHLFYEKRLSGNETMACASCHFQSLAFSDGKDFPKGITNEVHPRNSQHLSNVAYLPRLTWNNPNMANLEIQSRVPLFGDSPIELGLSDSAFLTKLRNDPLYKNLFVRAFGNDSDAVNEQNIRFALASFQRSLISGRSIFDKLSNRVATGLTVEEIQSINRGNQIFNSEDAECFHCHGGFNFTDTNLHSGLVTPEFAYHNNGTHTKSYYDSLLDINGDLDPHKQGLFEITLNEADQGKFRAPSLRNVGVTFPYMHDGSIKCDIIYDPNITAGATNEDCARNALGKVIDQYTNGGVAPVHPSVDTALIRPFSLTPQQKTDMINFLMSLTDKEFLENPKFSNPFPQ